MNTVQQFLCLALALALFALTATAMAADTAKTPRSHVTLVTESLGVPAAGGTISLGLHQQLQPGWHTYWINPGESGEPTTFKWQVPPGIAISEIVWPYPERIPFGELANYGFSEEVLLRVDVTVPAGLTPGTSIPFRLSATWLICKDICIPESAELDLVLPVVEGAPPKSEAWSKKFAETRAREPVPPGPFAGTFAQSGGMVTLHLVPTLNRVIDHKGAQFFPIMRGLIKASTEQKPMARGAGFVIDVAPGWRLRDPQQASQIKTLDGILVLPSVGDQPAQAFQVSVQRGAVPPAEMSPLNAISFLEAIGFAILGGLILNLMPCVFPILSMKALSLVQAGHTDRPWADGLAYLFGVMTTFAGLAAALLWLRSIGEDAGWGFQLQSPVSVAILAYILTLVGLNLSGVFMMGSSIQGAGDELTQSGGLVGSYFTGVLAVVVAAPCTAPFMGAAMSYAFLQPAPVTLSIFLALGLGLALPWVLVTMSPALVRLLPRPGAWMERFKQFLAFPMYGAAAWLVWVMSQQVSPEGLFRVMVGLVVLALAAWAYGVAQARSANSQSSFLSLVLFVIALASSLALLLMPFQGPAAAGISQNRPSSKSFAETYTAERLQKLRSEGRPVLVNLTAAWCVSCLYNEEVALSAPAVHAAFKATGTVYLVGDWTNKNPEVSALLRTHGRDGVPLYLYFPKGGGEPKILPQLLTESEILSTLKGAP